MDKSKNQSNKLKILKYMFMPLPFVLGTIGYLQYYDLHWALLKSAQLYTFNVDYIEGDLTIYAAAWLAMIATISMILLVLQYINAFLSTYFKTLSKNSCAVYGNSIYAEHLAKKLKSKSILSEKIISGAKKHVLLFNSDEENLEFYQNNIDKFANKPVFIKLNKAMPYMLKGDNVNVFNTAEITSRLFWRKYPIYQNERVAIIGFEELGQEILSSGVLMNIFSPRQRIEYNIWGNYSHFKGLHAMLDNIITNKFIFHDKDWQEVLFKSGYFNRLILCNAQSQNIIDLSIILSLYGDLQKPGQIFIYADDDSMLKELDVKTFGSTNEIYTVENILNDQYNKKAKDEYIQENHETSWESLNSFDKRLLISQTELKDNWEYHKELIMNGTAKDDNYLIHLKHILKYTFHWWYNRLIKTKYQELEDGSYKIEYNNGDIYEGELEINGNYENSTLCGQGKMFFFDGDIYNGKWKSDLRHGLGKMEYANGFIYEGEFDANYRDGHGKMIFPNKAEYDGEWDLDKWNEQGKYTSVDGAVYDVISKKGVIQPIITDVEATHVSKVEWIDDFPHVYLEEGLMGELEDN